MTCEPKAMKIKGYMMGPGRVGIGRRDVYKVPATIPQFKFTHTYVEWTEWTIPTYMYVLYIYCTFTRICLINLIFLILFPLHNIIHISCHIWLRCIPYNQAISLALYALVASTTYATLCCRPSCVCILQNVYYIQTMSYWVTSAAYITRECRGASTPRKLRQPTRAYTQLGWYIPCLCVCRVRVWRDMGILHILLCYSIPTYIPLRAHIIL